MKTKNCIEENQAFRLRTHAGKQGLKRFVITARWDEDTAEEIDVDARDEKEAKQVAKEVLEELYEPGYRKLTARAVFGLYM